ncbi:hypothetical protein ACX93W_21435 [Paenibacillus sp. CAU 1782]
MKRLQVFRGIFTITLLSLLIACSDSTSTPTLAPGDAHPPTTESTETEGEVLKLSENEIVKVSIAFRSGDSIGVIEEPSDLKELVRIVNNAPRAAGEMTSDDYGVFTFHLKNESTISLFFSGHGRWYEYQGNNFQIDETNVALLNALVDKIKQ